MDEMVVSKLLEKAKDCAQNAYCPYSSVPIGACVLTQNGMLFGGCNIENVAFECCSGAVEVALQKAVSEGCTNITALAIYSEEVMPLPSGKERQLIKEFSNRATIVCANKDEVLQFTINELLPFAKEQSDI